MLKHYSKKSLVTGDWSRFDECVPAWFIRDAFKMLARHIVWDTMVYADGKEWRVNPAKRKRRWEALVNYFIHPSI